MRENIKGNNVQRADSSEATLKAVKPFMFSYWHREMQHRLDGIPRERAVNSH